MTDAALIVGRPYHQSAMVGQSDDSLTAAPKAMIADATETANERTGPIGSVTGRPSMRMLPPNRSPKPGGFNPWNAPMRSANVATPAAVNTAPWIFSVFQKTSPYPRAPNHNAST